MVMKEKGKGVGKEDPVSRIRDICMPFQSDRLPIMSGDGLNQTFFNDGAQITYAIDRDQTLGYETSRFFFWLAYPLMTLMALLGYLQAVFYYLLGKKEEVKNRRLPRNPGFFLNGLSSLSAEIRRHAGTYLALDMVYNSRTNYYPQMKWLDRLMTWLWQDVIMINTKGVRNRLRLVERELYRLIINLANRNGTHEIRLLSVACGSAQGVLNVVERCKKGGISVQVTLLDLSQEALAFCQRQSSARGIKVTLINENTRYLEKMVEEGQRFDVIEIVGFLDYKTTEKCIDLMKLLSRLLRENGAVICANIRWNPERSFLSWVVSWQMVYKTEEVLASILDKAGYKRISLLTEPQKVHVVAICSIVGRN